MFYGLFVSQQILQGLLYKAFTHPCYVFVKVEDPFMPRPCLVQYFSWWQLSCDTGPFKVLISARCTFQWQAINLANTDVLAVVYHGMISVMHCHFCIVQIQMVQAEDYFWNYVQSVGIVESILKEIYNFLKCTNSDKTRRYSLLC